MTEPKITRYTPPDCSCPNCLGRKNTKTVTIPVLDRSSVPASDWLERFEYTGHQARIHGYRVADLAMMTHPTHIKPTSPGRGRPYCNLWHFKKLVEDDGVENYLSIDDAKAIREQLGGRADAFKALFGCGEQTYLGFYRSLAWTRKSSVLWVPVMYAKENRLIIRWFWTSTDLPFVLLPKLPV